MNRYLVEAKYADHAWAAMADKPQDRGELLRPVVEQLGGKVEHFWFSLEDRDAIVIVELPENVSAEALQIAGAAGGGFKGAQKLDLVKITAIPAADAFSPPSDPHRPRGTR